MAFSQSPVLTKRPDDTTLTRNMVGIRMNFAAEANPSAPIEETLVHASELGLDDNDLRVLAVLTTWLGTHHRHINVDRLVRTVSKHSSDRVRAYWAAIAHWFLKDRRFARIATLHDGPPVDLLPARTDFQIARRGEDQRFAGSALRVPAGTLRNREADILSPECVHNKTRAKTAPHQLASHERSARQTPRQSVSHYTHASTARPGPRPPHVNSQVTVVVRDKILGSA